MSAFAVLTSPRLREIGAFLDERRAALLAEAALVPDAAWQRRPATGGWSASELIEHLRTVEDSVARLMTKLVGDALAAGGQLETDHGPLVDASPARRAADRGRRIEAPARVAPRSAPERQAALQGLAASRAALLAAMRLGDGLALGALEWPHAVLGPMHLYDWLVFVGAHEERHAEQLREIREAVAPA